MWNTVLFDLDGTLTDSGEGITRCVQYALRKEFGIKVENLHDLDCFVGPPLKEQFMEFASLSEEEAERAIMAYRERYRTRGIYENRVYDGIPELLSQLVREGLTLAVTSSKPTEFCREILRYFGIEQYFRTVVGSELSGERSKKAEVIEETLRILGMTGRRGEVVIVGDRRFDVEGARKTGIGSIGVSYGYGSRKELETAWPDCITDTPEELRNVLIGQAREEKTESSPVSGNIQTDLPGAYQAGWGSSYPWQGYYGYPEGYYFPPQGYGVPQGINPPQGYYVPQSYPLPGYNYPPQGYYLPQDYRQVRNFDPQSPYKMPPYGYLAETPRTPYRKQESLIYKIWRCLNPLLIDLAVAFVVTNFSLFLFMMFAGNPAGGNRLYEGNSLLILGLTDLIGIVIYSLLFRADERGRIMDGLPERMLRFGHISFLYIPALILFVPAVSALISSLVSTLPIFPNDIYSALEDSIMSSGWLLQLIVVCVTGPIAEELLYRGLIYRRVRDYTGCAWAAVISGVIFGIAHGNLYQGVYAAIFGILMALIYEHFGTIWMAILGHVVNNLVATFLDPLISGMGAMGQTVYLASSAVAAILLGIVIFSKKNRINAV